MRSPEEYIDGLIGTNDKYDTKATLGSYRTSGKQFSNPKDMVHFNGFGMNDADYARGFCDPNIKELPEYQKSNYRYRLTEERVDDDDVDDGLGVKFNRDLEFQRKDRVTTGLFARPLIPNER